MKRPSHPIPGKLILLGKILQEWGIRGQVRFLSFNPQSTLYPDLKTIYIEGSEGRVLQIEGAVRHGRYWLFKFQGYENPEQARELRGLNLGLPREALPKPRRGEIYLSDLEGVQVRDWEGRDLGSVVGFLHVGEGEVLRIALCKGGEALIPYRVDFVQETNLTAGWLRLTELAEDLL